MIKAMIRVFAYVMLAIGSVWAADTWFLGNDAVCISFFALFAFVGEFAFLGLSTKALPKGNLPLYCSATGSSTCVVDRSSFRLIFILLTLAAIGITGIGLVHFANAVREKNCCHTVLETKK